VRGIATPCNERALLRRLAASRLTFASARGGIGRLAGNKAATAAHVEAVIGRGTNTAGEKARFIAGMMNVLSDVLGPGLADESYVVLHEVDKDAYGRGGMSRAERDRQRVRLTHI